ncbi:hypothetical protein E2C01_032122 [Portunus trituberculatus]|uniref:Uncharacterized protein n=1 Tax=Portunus trituberculatus TaxID=210409 RepID=A0A5B7EV82_PORTR|nr:hypothetical protein [Portunus trituberculatus]
MCTLHLVSSSCPTALPLAPSFVPVIFYGKLRTPAEDELLIKMLTPLLLRPPLEKIVEIHPRSAASPFVLNAMFDLLPGDARGSAGPLQLMTQAFVNKHLCKHTNLLNSHQRKVLVLPIISCNSFGFKNKKIINFKKVYPSSGVEQLD